MTVTVYSKPACVQCTQTKNLLKNKGIAFVEKDVTQDPEAYELVAVVWGLRQMPVVTTDDDKWSGFKKEKIDALVA